MRVVIASDKGAWGEKLYQQKDADDWAADVAVIYTAIKVAD